MTNKHTNNKQHQLIADLKRLEPSLFDKNGKIVLEQLTAYLNNTNTEFSREAYSLNWLGKSYAKALVYDDNQTLLAANHEHNQQHTNSQNLLIKGDNLAVLKHLQEAYRQQVKMIYIDPPYNTGSDGFVYCDDRKYTAAQISAMTGESEESAERIFSFINRQSSSHSAWLTFMYPRLKVARELLREDGVIFISIDDNEQAQLKMLCDEVFGEENFVAVLPWKGRGGGADDKNLLQNHEYVLMYVRNTEDFTVGRKIKKDEKFPKFDEDKQRFYKTQLARKWGSNSKREDRPNLFYSVHIGDLEIYPSLPDGSDGCWRWKKERLEAAIQHNDVEHKVREDGKWEIYEKIYEPLVGEKRTKLYSAWLLDEVYDELEDILETIQARNTAFGTKQLKALFNQVEVFKYPKPTALINVLTKISNIHSNDLILDFFAGSGTTAHAVMQLNAEDGGNRRYICVQLDEKTDPKSEAHKAGYPTIFDICKARIEKAAAKIREEHPDYQGDLGFQEFKLIDYPEHYGAKPDNPQQGKLFAELDLDKTTSQAILTTWCVQDGLPLTQTPTAVDLGDYTAFMAQDKLYLLDKGFNSTHLAHILKRLDDTQDEFNIARMVVLGHHFDSKTQRELKEAVMQYKPRKGNHLDLVVRYE